MEVNDLLLSWGSWARKGQDNLGYSSINTIAKFSSGAGFVDRAFEGNDAPEIAIVDNAISALSRMHPNEGEIIKMTYVHRMPVSRIAKALNVGRGQVREKSKFALGWIESFLISVVT